MKSALLRYLLFASVVLFLGRAFSDSYLGYPVSLGVIAFFLSGASSGRRDP